MADDSGTIKGTSEGGVAGTHPSADILPVFAAPATADEFNTVRFPLIPVACWRVDDIRFEFDSSFVRPSVRGEVAQLSRIVREHPGSPISLFGHADPVGNDDYNKILSGRRAAAIYAMLTRDADIWEDLFSNKGVFAQPAAGDKWGKQALETMTTEVSGPPPAGSKPALPQTAGARQKLYLAYMDAICQDANGKPFKLDKKRDFLAHNEDPAGKGDFQGCGEFNPVFIFSAKDNARFEQSADKTERNEANASNRRVVAYLFRKDSRVTPAKWPCPRAKEGVAGCKKRFWSDGENRRSKRLPDDPRQFEKTKDTFACRFYHRFAVNSPCDKAQARASWITEIPAGLEEDILLLIRNKGGGEIARLKPEQAAPGPAENRTFDLSQLDPNVAMTLELHAGQRFIAPLMNLSINPLRVSLEASSDEGIGASLFVAEDLAGASNPFDDDPRFDTSNEPLYPREEEPGK